MQERPSYDQTLKRLLTQAHDGLVELLLPGAVWKEELSSELPDAPRTADLVWLIEWNKERAILHIELQTKAESDIGLRVAHYALRLHERYKLGVLTYVLYLRPTSIPRLPPFQMSAAGMARMTYYYDIIKLWELDPDPVLATQNYALWPLAGLMANVTAESTFAVAERIAAAPLSRHQQSEFTGLLVLLAGTRIDRDLILQLLGRRKVIDDIIKESSFYQILTEWGREEGLVKGVAEGLQQGLQQGIEQGIEQGKLAAERQLACDALSEHFGDVGAEVLDRVNALSDTALLRRIILKTEEFPDIAAVIAAIGAVSPPSKTGEESDAS